MHRRSCAGIWPSGVSRRRLYSSCRNFGRDMCAGLQRGSETCPSRNDRMVRKTKAPPRGSACAARGRKWEDATKTELRTGQIWCEDVDETRLVKVRSPPPPWSSGVLNPQSHLHEQRTLVRAGARLAAGSSGCGTAGHPHRWRSTYLANGVAMSRAEDCRAMAAQCDLRAERARDYAARVHHGDGPERSYQSPHPAAPRRRRGFWPTRTPSVQDSDGRAGEGGPERALD